MVRFEIVNMYRNTTALLGRPVELDTSMDALIHSLGPVLRSTAEVHRQDLFELDSLPKGRRGFYGRFNLNFDEDHMPIRNTLVHEDRYGLCRFQGIKDLFTTAEIEKAEGSGTPLVVPLLLSLRDMRLKTSSDGSYEIGADFGSAPKLHAVIVENDLSHQSLEGKLKFTSAYEGRFAYRRLDPASGEHAFVSIPGDKTMNQVESLDWYTCRQDLLDWVVQMAHAGETSRTGEPMMTFNSFKRSPAIQPCPEVKTLYLIVRLVNEIGSIGLGHVQLLPMILLRIKDGKLRSKRVKNILMAVMVRYPIARASEIMAVETRSQWEIQLWVMPQVDREQRKLHLYEKQDVKEFLNPAWFGDGGAACLYVEAHLVPRFSSGRMRGG